MTEPEGATPLTPDERAGMRFRHVQTRGELDRLEQANLQDGMRWLDKQRQPDVLSEAFARKLHQKLFGEVWRWAGQFRATEKNIGVAPERIAVALHDHLKDAQHWAGHGTYPPVELALRFHHRLVQIHCFANGNGRHARIMTDALCTHVLKIPPIRWAGSDLQASSAHRRAYIRALQAADAHDIGPLLVLFGEPGRQ